MWSERRRRLLFDSQHFCGFIDILLPALVASDLEGDEGHRALAARSHHRERQLTYSESRRFKWASFIAITWSSRSRRQLSTQRSASPFCQGRSREVRARNARLEGSSHR